MDVKVGIIHQICQTDLFNRISVSYTNQTFLPLGTIETT